MICSVPWDVCYKTFYPDSSCDAVVSLCGCHGQIYPIWFKIKEKDILSKYINSTNIINIVNYQGKIPK